MTDQHFEITPEAADPADNQYAADISAAATELDKLVFPTDRRPNTQDILPGDLGPENFVG